MEVKNSKQTSKVILRKLNIDPLKYHLSSTFCSRTGNALLIKYLLPNFNNYFFYETNKYLFYVESCVYYPKLPRSWIPDGLIIVPCLSEKGMKGGFELEVYTTGPNFC